MLLPGVKIGVPPDTAAKEPSTVIAHSGKAEDKLLNRPISQ